MCQRASLQSDQENAAEDVADPRGLAIALEEHGAKGREVAVSHEWISSEWDSAAPKLQKNDLHQ